MCRTAEGKVSLGVEARGLKRRDEKYGIGGGGAEERRSIDRISRDTRVPVDEGLPAIPNEFSTDVSLINYHRMVLGR